MKRLFLFSFVFIIICGLIGCNEKDIGTAEGKNVIAVTIAPQRAFVSAVCGGLAHVITVVPPGFSPESYEPAPKQRKALLSASLYFSIGVNAESNILPLGGKTKIVALHEETARVFPDLAFDDGGRDPHIWLSPKRAAVMIDIIANELSLQDPANKDFYHNNAQSFKTALSDASDYVKNMLAGASSKSFISYHPAFNYFANEYNLKMYALEKEGKEATAKELLQIVNLARQNNIKTIFYQQEIDSSQSKAFAEEIGGKAVMLEPLSEDYIENIKAMARAIAEN